jgi:TatA/E family protein of Tat protein translocase
MIAFLSDTGIVVAVIAFVALFGASQIPKLARNLGEAGREFRKAHAELADPIVATPTLPAATAGPDDRVTLTRAQLDALIANPAAPARH